MSHLCVLFFFLYLVVVEPMVVDLYVHNSTTDTQDNYDPSACTPSSSSSYNAIKCNLRSAFGYCTDNVFVDSSSSSTCMIHLYSDISITFNSTLGSLFYSPDESITSINNHLYILGNGSSIVSSSSMSTETTVEGNENENNSNRFMHLANTSVTFTNMTIQGFTTYTGGMKSLLPICLSIYVSICVSIYLPICLLIFVCLFVSLSLWLFVSLHHFLYLYM